MIMTQSNTKKGNERNKIIHLKLFQHLIYLHIVMEKERREKKVGKEKERKRGKEKEEREGRREKREDKEKREKIEKRKK